MIKAHQPIHGQDQTASRSNFVTKLAWIFIVVGGFATFISLLQAIMFNLSFPLSEMQAFAQSTQHPWIVKLIFTNLQLYLGGFIVISVVTLIASVGLLQRRNWARRAFIGLMVLGIFWNIGSLVVQQLMFSEISFPGLRARGFSMDVETFLTVIQVFSVVQAVALSALFGWIIWRLTSKPIAAEFRSGGSGSA